jgi:general stress protein 26
MKFTKRPYWLAVLLVFATTMVAQQPPAEHSKAKLMEAALQIMEASRYCALITTDPSGRLEARAMDPFEPDDKMQIWFGTNPRSRKVTHIRRNPRVMLYYFDREGQGYVTIHGLARIVTDPKAKAKWWKEEWKEFYPERAKGYVLIAVMPQRLEVISEKNGIFGDPITWKPPSVMINRLAHQH